MSAIAPTAATDVIGRTGPRPTPRHGTASCSLSNHHHYHCCHGCIAASAAASTITMLVWLDAGRPPLLPKCESDVSALRWKTDGPTGTGAQSWCGVGGSLHFLDRPHHFPLATRISDSQPQGLRSKKIPRILEAGGQSSGRSYVQWTVHHNIEGNGASVAHGHRSVAQGMER